MLTTNPIMWIPTRNTLLHNISVDQHHCNATRVGDDTTACVVPASGSSAGYGVEVRAGLTSQTGGAGPQGGARGGLLLV